MVIQKKYLTNYKNVAKTYDRAAGCLIRLFLSGPTVCLTALTGPRNIFMCRLIYVIIYCPRSNYFAVHELTGWSHTVFRVVKCVPYCKWESSWSRQVCVVRWGSILFIVHTYKDRHSLRTMLAVLLFWIACIADRLLAVLLFWIACAADRVSSNLCKIRFSFAGQISRNTWFLLTHHHVATVSLWNIFVNLYQFNR